MANKKAFHLREYRNMLVLHIEEAEKIVLKKYVCVVFESNISYYGTSCFTGGLKMYRIYFILVTSVRWYPLETSTWSTSLILSVY